MKRLRIFSFLLVLVIGLACTSLFVSAGQTKKPVKFNISSHLLDGPTPAIEVDAMYGDVIAVDENVDLPEGYEFAFWLYNGVVKNVPINHKFRITETTDIAAVFTPTDKHAVVFMDTNGQMLDVQFVEEGGNAETIDGPTKPGYEFAGWDKSLNNITENTIITAQYNLSESTTFNLTVYNGSTAKTEYNFNEVATVTALPERAGLYFSHWQVGNKIVSKQLTYSFTMLQDVTIIAVYSEADEYEDTPLVTLSDKIELRTGMDSYIGQIYIPEGFKLIERGMLISESEGIELTLDSEETYQRIESTARLDDTKEFLMTFDPSIAKSVRAYLICEDSEGTLHTYYNEEVEAGAAATDLFISEYIEGSSNNKAIEIYNGTGQDVDLSEYTIENCSNGKASGSGSKIPLSGTLANGEVFVVVNNQANAEFKAKANLESSNISHNGDDAYILWHNDKIIDSFGVVGTDPGTAWSGGDVSTVDMTLVRKPSITSGDTIIDDEFDPSIEWIGYPLDTLDYLGSHTMEGGVAPIVILPSSISITGEKEVTAGYSINLEALVYPEQASQKVIWTSSNEEIATVDENGKVTGLSAGQVTITATSEIDSNITNTIDITINPNMSEDVLYYSTDFEDGKKSSYASGTVTLNGKEWTLSDALIGKDANDKKNGSGSVRAQNSGYIQSNFKVSKLSKIEFYHAVYGTDALGKTEVYISLNGIDWILLESYNYDGTLTLVSLEIDYTKQELINAGITESSEVFIKIQKNGGKRVNFDDLSLYTK